MEISNFLDRLYAGSISSDQYAYMQNFINVFSDDEVYANTGNAGLSDKETSLFDFSNNNSQVTIDGSNLQNDELYTAYSGISKLLSDDENSHYIPDELLEIIEDTQALSDISYDPESNSIMFTQRREINFFQKIFGVKDTRQYVISLDDLSVHDLEGGYIPENSNATMSVRG